jgi:Tol biopolymer transport system component
MAEVPVKRLDSWKEIAGYLHRDVRTAIRWEKEKALPVHRVPGGKRHVVFAYTAQIDAWMSNGAGESERSTGDSSAGSTGFGQQDRDVSPSAPGEQTTRAVAMNIRGFRLAYLAYAVIPIALAAALIYLLTRPTPVPRVLSYTQLTRDGRMKVGKLVTDGPRVYFTEKAQDGWLIAQIATVGGEVVPVSEALKNPLVQDLSQARSELLLIDAAGSAPCPLFTLPLPGDLPRRVGNVLATSAAWSPDGQAIAYTAEGGVYLCESDGQEPRKIASVRGVATHICWHPNGSLLRFTVTDPRSNSDSIWEVRPDGAKLHPFLSGWFAPQWVRSESWTADGRFFILTSHLKDSGDLFVLREGGPFAELQRRRLAQLTAGPMDFGGAVPSRDGKRVFSLGSIVQSEVQRYDRESRQFVPYLPNISADHVDFSKDGQWMAYVASSGNTLWKRRINGTQALQLTFPPMITELPRWSPDGKWIAVMGQEPARPWKVHVISAEGGAPQALTPGGDQEGAPTWSSDGGRVVFGGLVASDVRSTGPLAIHIVDLRTHEGSTLPGSEGLWTARWSPSGRYIAALTADSQSLMLFDFSTRKWAKLLTVSFIADITWSRREESIFLAYSVPSGEEFSISRLRLWDRTLEEVVRLPGRPWSFWLGLTPEDSPLIVRQAGVDEVYALDWQSP